MGKVHPPEDNGIILYTADDGKSHIRVLLQHGTVWLPQSGIAVLYQTTPQNITLHIKAIYTDGELNLTSTCKEYLQVLTEGNRTVRRKIKHYNLDMILAVGYRVRSSRGVQFRQWATEHLREYLVKGFVLDDERLKGGVGVEDYFDELLARIRDIRASEARVYQRIRDIFSLAVDYQSGDPQTQTFFAAMQNKIHYAATGLTAAEIILRRSNAAMPNMGLTSWKGNRIRKSDAEIAKNYLGEREIDTLNRITVMFLDQAEFRALRRQNIRISDWEAFLDKFLADTELAVLENSGSVSHQEALDRAWTQYEEFSVVRQRNEEELAEKNYLDDLRKTAELLERKRKS